MAQNAHSATAPASGTAAHAAQTRNGFICLFTTYAIWGMLPDRKSTRLNSSH